MDHSLREIAGVEGEILLEVVQQLSYARDLPAIMTVVKRAARQLVHADGVTFVLRDGDLCFYADEDAVAPLWKGQRFPQNICVSGWAMLHRESVIIEDIAADPRVPHDVYAKTFVKSLAMVPIRVADPLGAIGAYWAKVGRPTQRQMTLLEALAAATATALVNAQLYHHLEDAVRQRDDFLMVAAHELRTPLTPLKLQLDALEKALENGRSAADLGARLTRAQSYVERLGRLVETLLDQSRVWTNRLVIERTTCDLAAVASTVIGRTGPRATQARCEMSFETPGPVLGSWDVKRLEQAIFNLVDNALKFGAGKPVVVTISTDEREATLVVRDSGTGIAAADQERIFQRLERGVSIGSFGGFGLGLWMTQRIAEAHGGGVTVESAPGEGAAFRLSLPI